MLIFSDNRGSDIAKTEVFRFWTAEEYLFCELTLQALAHVLPGDDATHDKETLQSVGTEGNFQGQRGR